MSKKPPAPQIVYSPPPPPPAPPTQVPTQSLQTQVALNETSGAQQRLNMELGAQLDRTNAEFFAGQDVRRYQSQGAEGRMSIATSGEQQRLGYAAAGEQERLGIAATGEQARSVQAQLLAGQERQIGLTGGESRRTQQERFTGETGLIRETGTQQRETVGRTASEQRMTDLQQEMFRRYKEDRDYTQAQRQYRT
jgi:hypothetical protein